MEDNEKNGSESRCILLLADLEKEEVAFLRKGPGELPEFPRVELSLATLRSKKTLSGVKLKPVRVGKIYFKMEDGRKVYYEIIFINSTNYNQVFWEALFGIEKKVVWLTPVDITRSQRRPKCALTLAGLREFIRHCGKSRNKLLRKLGEELQNGSIF